MRKTIKEIMGDLVEHIQNERPILPTDKDNYYYDRPKWISQHGYFNDTDDMSKKEQGENGYLTCLETLRIMIYQVHFFNHILHTNEDGKDVYNNKLITEKTTEINT